MKKDYVKRAKMWRDVGRTLFGDLAGFLFGIVTGFVLSPLLPVIIDKLRRSIFTIPWL